MGKRYVAAAQGGICRTEAMSVRIKKLEKLIRVRTSADVGFFVQTIMVYTLETEYVVSVRRFSPAARKRLLGKRLIEIIEYILQSIRIPSGLVSDKNHCHDFLAEGYASYKLSH
jgi:hypothetical protein